MADLDDLTRDYRTAFQRYLPQRSEAALTLGYEIGRRSVGGGISLLDLVEVHHVVLAETLGGSPAHRTGPVVEAASEFLREVLATVDMVQRGVQPRSPARNQGS